MTFLVKIPDDSTGTGYHPFMSNREDRDGSYEGDLQQAKDESVGQLLLQAARLWNERAIERLRGENPSLRPAHTHLLPHISSEGIKLTELAARVGTSKQAVGELVDDLEAQGYVERIPDPHDRRAKRVRFTPAGQRSVFQGLALLRRIEEELAEKLGKKRMRELGETLRRLLPLLGKDDSLP